MSIAMKPRNSTAAPKLSHRRMSTKTPAKPKQAKPIVKPSSQPAKPIAKSSPKPVSAASVASRNLWQSWMVLPPQTRLKISAIIFAWSGLALIASYWLEDMFPGESNMNGSWKHESSSPSS
ncbi:hypothetical protein OE88DRAFT_41145 [Heliocybe sulcata]|uniref:Uncharacterized protein n=1 Tax=Heliocybe sulcata TaxID=5364 RepID=A0A5C3NFV0_9AGAM|nr:hypothetical protein OE88DRAFT_41145 [Heliocybe sulcata]